MDEPLTARMMQSWRRVLIDLLNGEQNGAFICGPAGMGKDFTVDDVARHFHITPLKPKPSSLAAVHEILSANRNYPLIVFEDCDIWAKDIEALNYFKHLCDAGVRIIDRSNLRTVREGTARFILNAKVVTTSNTNPRDLRGEMKDHAQAMLDRLGLAAMVLPFDPKACLDHCGYMVAMGFLRHKFPTGTRAQSEEVLAWFYKNAARLERISLRTLEHAARARMKRPGTWEDDCDALLRHDGYTWFPGPTPLPPLIGGKGQQASWQAEAQPAASQSGIQTSKTRQKPSPFDLANQVSDDC